MIGDGEFRYGYVVLTFLKPGASFFGEILIIDKL